MPEECSLCSDPRTPEVLYRVQKGEITLQEAARILGVSYKMLWRHVRYHEQLKLPETYATDALQVLGEIKQTLLDILRVLKERSYDHETIRDIAVAARELRNTILDIEKVSGRLRSAPLVQLQQINILYEELVAFMATELCEECRKKVLVKLKKFKKKNAYA